MCQWTLSRQYYFLLRQIFSAYGKEYVRRTRVGAIFRATRNAAVRKKIVEKARREAPVRKVQSRTGNVITHYQSRKMNRSLASESRTVEFPAIVGYEFDQKVIEYYAQPVELDVVATEDTGKKARFQHTPDFLILAEDEIRIEEWRESERLKKLAEKSPGRYIWEGTHWRQPVFEEMLAYYGIVYRLRTPEEHPGQYLQNIQFLADYLASDYPPVEIEEVNAIKACFATRNAMTIGELIEMGISVKDSQ